VRIDLVGEYCAAMRRTPLTAVQDLHTRYGIPWRAITATALAPMMVTFADKGRLYKPAAAHGFPVWVSPVAVVDPERPEEIEATDPLDVVQTGPFVDLVAFHPGYRNRFARRTGLAPVLGCIPPNTATPILSRSGETSPIGCAPNATGWSS
jgi:hypothetical protein